MKITRYFASLEKVVNVQKVIQNLLAIKLKKPTNERHLLKMNAIQDIDCECV